MIRFKKDDGSNYPDWEEKRINEVCKIHKGATLSKADISEEGTPFILYGELYTTYGEVATEIVRKTNKEVDAKYYSKIGDVIIPTSGESPEEISTATCVMKDGVILAGDLNIYRSKELDGRYFSYLMNHCKKYDVARIAQGASIIHIQASEVGKIKIPVPSFEEQQKIADFLSSVDEIISASEKEVSNLEEQKKGVMQKIFSQEIRFKANDGSDYPDWEENALSTYLQIRDEKQEETEEAPLMAFIAYKGVAEKGDRYDRSALVKTEHKKYKRTELNDFIYSSNNLDVGSIGLNKYGTAVISVVYEIFKINKKALPEILNLIIQIPENMNKIIKYRQGCCYGQYKIYPEDFLKVKVKVPCLEEQEKISQFIVDADTAIEKAKAELECWKEIKKGLLQQLFE